MLNIEDQRDCVEKFVTFTTAKRFYKGFWTPGMFRLWGCNSGVAVKGKRDLVIFLASLPENI